MKSLKNLLAALAFVFAIGAAFATAAFETRSTNNIDGSAVVPDRKTDCANPVTCVIDGQGASCDSYLHFNSLTSTCVTADDGYEEP